MQEKNFQSQFNHWCKNFFKRTAAFELKITHTNSLPFDSVKPHQEMALTHAKHNTLVFKIPDVGYQNPFDSFCLSGVNAYVVVKYPSYFYLIDIDTWIEERFHSDRKSLTEERAQAIGIRPLDQ